MKNNRVILLEFNELCPNLTEKFIAQGHLPNFEAFSKNARRFTTNTDCEKEYLEPWIQWVTLHTGLRFEEHKIYRLGQSENLMHDAIWDILSKKGKTSWICGSMNVKINPNDSNVSVLPDPWSINSTPNPTELSPFYSFVRANVQEHTNENHSMSITDYAAFIWFMLNNGLSFSTVSRIMAQLFKQITKANDRWKKATILDALQWDVFEYRYKKTQPAFATFFSNSTAHFQHKFWRYMDPKSFSLDISEENIDKYGNAVLYGYQNHDQLIGKAMALADDDTTIILATGLSQQPFLDKELEGGKRFHRPHNLDNLPMQLGLKGVNQVLPVMSHQFHLVCSDDESTAYNEALLNRLKVDGKPLFVVTREENGLFVGCAIMQPLAGGETVQVGEKSILFSDLFYLADNLKSGSHHPHGLFWVYQKDLAPEKIDTLLPLHDSTKIILDTFGLSDEPAPA